jgi:hypothetical protein
MEQLVCSGGIPAVPWNIELSESRSEPFCRGEECSEFCMYHGTKIEANSRNFVLNYSTEQKTLGIPFRTVSQRRKMLVIPFRGKEIEANSQNSVPKHISDKKNAVYSILFMPFSSILSLGTDSSINLGRSLSSTE